MKIPNNTLVLVHSTGSKLIDGIVCKVRGLAFYQGDLPGNMYILEPTRKVDLDGYDCFVLTDACFNTIADKVIEPLSLPLTAWKLDWMESERGWGRSEDGTTLHIDLAEAKRYVEEFYANERKRNPSGVVPDCYTQPDCEPTLVNINADLALQLQQTPSFWVTTSKWWKGIDK